MGKLVANGIGIVFLVVGLLGLVLGIVRYVTASEMAESISGAAKVAGVKSPTLQNETLRAGMKQEGLLFMAGGVGSSVLGLVLLRRPSRTGKRGLQLSEVDRLVQDLRSPRVEVRWSAAQRLGELKEAAQPAIPALTEALNDPDALVRTAASDALQSID